MHAYINIHETLLFLYEKNQYAIVTVHWMCSNTHGQINIHKTSLFFRKKVHNCHGVMDVFRNRNFE